MENVQHAASGSVVLWRLKATDRAALSACLGKHNLGIFMPNPKTESACLKQALAAVSAKAITKDYTFRVSTRKGLPDDYAGWQLDHVLLDPSGRNVTTPLAGLSVRTTGPSAGSIHADWIEPVNLNYFSDFMPDVRAASKHAANSVEVAAMGSTCAAIVKHLQGVTLRDGGGVYWVPEVNFPDWEAFASDLEGLATINTGGKNRVLILRTTHDLHTVRSVMDTLADEVTAKVTAIKEELASEDLGDKALQHRLEQAQETLSHVEDYEKWLGQTDLALKAQLGELMCTLGETIAADDAQQLFDGVF